MRRRSVDREAADERHIVGMSPAAIRNSRRARCLLSQPQSATCFATWSIARH